MDKQPSSAQNIEQTPFQDLRNTKDNYVKENILPSMSFIIPTYHEDIKWEKIIAKKKFNQKKYDIPCKNQREIIDKIIHLFKSYQTFDLTLGDNPSLVQLLRSNKDMIEKYSNQKFPKAVVAQFLFSLNPELENQFVSSSSLEKLENIVKQTQYPLAIAILALVLMNKNSNGEQIDKLFRKTIYQYGESYAYQHYGYYFYLKKQFLKAYVLYKNAEQSGYAPIIYYRLAQIFTMREDINFRPNIIAARKYFQKGKSSIAKTDLKLQAVHEKYQQQLKKGQIQSKKVISTIETQSKVVATFIKNKYQQILSQKNFPMFICNKVLGGESFCIRPKTFYVVFTPYLCDPSRPFLGENQDGTIQLILIYNWKQIQPEQLGLLHKLGTKVVLNEYLRLYDPNDRLPMYRVQNPYSIQFHPPTEKHFIQDDKYREFAKNLFQNSSYEHCKTIYNHLINKKASGLEIIYSNLGLISQKQLKISEAKAYYIKSMNVKDYDKTFFRLGRIYLDEGNIEKAVQLSQKMTEKIGKLELQALIEQRRKKMNKQNKQTSKQQFQQVNVKKLKFIKKTQKLPQYIVQGELVQLVENNNKSAATKLVGDIVRYFQFFKVPISSELSIDQSLSLKQYIQQLQRIFDSAELPLRTENLEIIRKFFDFSYYEMRKYTQETIQERMYDQAYGYNKYFYKQNYFAPDIRHLGIQFANCLAKRCNYLEIKIEKECIQLEKNQKYAKAEEIYQCSNNYCLPFCVKIAQLKFKQGKYQQNIEYCQSIILYLKKIPKNMLFFGYFVRTAIELMKSFQVVKKYKQSIQEGEKILDFIKLHNPQHIHARVTNEPYHYLYQDQQVYMKQNYSGVVCNLMKYIANAYQILQQYEKALKYLNQKCLKDLKKADKEMYFQALLLKIKIIIKQNGDKKTIRKNLDEGLKSAEQLNVQNIYKLAILKQMLVLNLEQQKIGNIQQLINKIMKIDPRYSNTIVKKVVQICWMKKEQFLNKIFETLKKLNYLDLAQTLIEQLKNKTQTQKIEIKDKGKDKEVNHPEQIQLQLDEQFKDNLEGFYYITSYIYQNLKSAIYFSHQIVFEKGQEHKFINKAQSLCNDWKENYRQADNDQQIQLQIQSNEKLIGNKIIVNGTSYLMFIKKVISQ